MKRPLSIVIFSKDRAAQLDLCLKSIYKNLSSLSEHWKIYVIYTASSEDFEDGYNQLIKEWYSGSNSVYFFPEYKYNGFKKTLEYCIKHWEDQVLFFTDDDIVYRKFEHNYEDIADSELFCTSFRLGTNTFVQDQYTNSNCLVPDEVIMGDGIIRTWNWKNQRKDTNFAYPFSVDGHMLPSRLAKKIINSTPKYYNPNSLEGKAQNYIQDDIENMPDDMSCFEKSFMTKLFSKQDMSSGAHFGEEYLSYIDNGISRVVFIEPLKENFQVLENIYGSVPDVTLINKGAGSEKKQLNIYKSSNNLVSSSVLKPKTHLEQHPEVLFDDGQTVIDIDRIDNMLEDIIPYNFMNVDVQGYELEVFKGAGEFLDLIDFIMTEVNREEVYENCCQVEEIDEYLAKYKFKRVESKWHGCWGDAFYIKDRN